MAKITKALKTFGRQIWELFKNSIVPALMYFFASSVILLVSLNDVDQKWNDNKLIWTIILAIACTAYDAYILYVKGGEGYEMLVSGNMKRLSSSSDTGEYIISKHKYAKEYRPWKGFAIALFSVALTIIASIIFGINQTEIDQASIKGVGGLTVLVLLAFVTAGWAIIPVFYMNASGMAVSYYFCALFAVVPFIVMGVMYIVGAYAKRNKRLREQEERAAQEAKKAEAKKKINYGALPGTKPRKRK